jgi:hypothetical protein
MPKKTTIDDLVELAKAAATTSAEYQERFAAEDTEARKIVDTMEHFLRVKARVVYGGAAINAHLSAARKFYDPNLNLPDYDFMTPDPLQDCADLIVAFQQEGFTEVEAKFGIHEGTYKVFVNFRAAADITYMPPDIYDRVIRDAAVIDGIQYASINFLRMNMYVELSRPAGMVSRWPKVYERLLLLNEEHPLKPGRCSSSREATEPTAFQKRIVDLGIETGAIFLSGARHYLEPKSRRSPVEGDVILMISDKADALIHTIKEGGDGIRAVKHDSLGELLPTRTELFSAGSVIAVVFETVSCHNYITLTNPAGYRLGSLDLLIQMYYAMYFAELNDYLPGRLLCLIQELIDVEHANRLRAAASGDTKGHDVFPLDCVGHQPTMPELKRAHRERVKAKREELIRALAPIRGSRQRGRSRRTRTRNKK